MKQSPEDASVPSWTDSLIESALSGCHLCPHRCGVDRFRGEFGRCGGGLDPTIFRFGPHFGEEPPLTGHRGSGVLFFSGCPLRCTYCQNYRWSAARPLVGFACTRAQLVEVMLQLERYGCHNINAVTPEPWAPHLIQAIRQARTQGLTLPIVYNTSGFVSAETLAMLKGTVDIYVTDLRYGHPRQAQSLSGCAEYFAQSRLAATAMWEQVGPLECDRQGIARRGLIIRHLLLPGLIDATASVLAFIAHNLPEAHVSLMGQFEPAYHARNNPMLGHRVPMPQYLDAVRRMRALGLTRGWRQRPGPADQTLLGTMMLPTAPPGQSSR